MKKLYSTLALAAAVSVSAIAGVKTVNVDDAIKADNMAVANNIEQVVKNNDNGREKALNYTTADQIAGYYILYTNSGFDSDDHEGTLYIAKGAAADEVIVYGFWNGFGKTGAAGGVGVKGTVKNEGGRCTIVFAQQVIGSFKDGTNVVFYPYDPFSNPSTVVDTMTLTVCPEGVSYTDGSSAYEDGCIAMLGRQAFFLSNPAIIGQGQGYSLMYNSILCPLDIYGAENQQLVTIDESEWQGLSNGKFDEGYLYPLTHGGQRQAAYDVNVLQKKDGSDVFLIKNPFGTGTPFANVNADKNGTGYIYIDATNPDLVCVRPLVYSGMEDLDSWEGRIFCANDEGVQLFLDESSYDDILDYFDYYEIPASTMTKNGDQVTINILNGVMAEVTDLFTYAPWTAENGNPIPCESKLTFTLEAGAVNGIINDADNAATRYFNLQGVEIAQPAAGEVVIVKEGNKTSKTIVR